MQYFLSIQTEVKLLKHYYKKLLTPTRFRLMKYFKVIRDESEVDDEEFCQRENYLAY